MMSSSDLPQARYINQHGVASQMQTNESGKQIDFELAVKLKNQKNKKEVEGEEETQMGYWQVVLQLKGRSINIVEKTNEKILLSFECSPRIKFQITQNESQKQNQVNHSRQLKFFREGQSDPFLRCQVDRKLKKNLEFLGKLLAARPIMRLNFHANFKPLQIIGKGVTSVVYRVVHIKEGTHLAVKSFNKNVYFAQNGNSGRASFEKQLQILSNLNNKYLCKYNGAYESQNSIYILLELVEKSLNNFLMKNIDSTRKTIKSIMFKLLVGVNELHRNGIMHRDLKPENIMLRVNKEGNLEPVIIDFGLAEYIEEKNYLYYKCGTPGYAAPEIFSLTKQNRSTFSNPEKCDVFSLGIIFYMLLIRKSVFLGETSAQVLENNKAGKFTLDEESLDHACPQLKDLLVNMLEVDVSKRPSVEQCLLHQSFVEERKEEIQFRSQLKQLLIRPPVEKSILVQ